jgi:hypothetical protein
MKTRLIYPIVVVVFAAACGGDGDGARKGAGDEYETVQEGSAAGVASSIAGPGETLPPITDTNADTTSAFALNPNAAPMSPQPSAAMAGTMPPPAQPAYNGGMSPSYNPPPRTASPATSPAQPRQVYVPPPMTSSARPAQPQPPPKTETTQPQNDEQATGPAPGTDTSATNTAPPPPPPTNTAPPPSEKPQQPEEPQEEEQPEEPPPPPPPPAR